MVVTDLRSSFQAWIHATKHSRLRKDMTVHTRQQKKARFQEQMTRAAQADRAHDQRQPHLIVRELSPKQPNRPIRFRSVTGLAQSPEVELDLLDSVLRPSIVGLPLSCLVPLFVCHACHSRLQTFDTIWPESH